MHLILVLGLHSKKCTESALISRGANEEMIVFYTGCSFKHLTGKHLSFQGSGFQKHILLV